MKEEQSFDKKGQTDLEKVLNIPHQKDEPEFIKLYFRDISKLYGLQHNTFKLFMELIKFIDYKPTTFHNVITLTRAKRQSIFKELDWKSYVPLHRGLKELEEKTLLKKLDADTFMVSVDICAKANWSDVKLIKKLDLKISYDMVQRTLITFVEMQDEDNQKSLAKATASEYGTDQWL